MKIICLIAVYGRGEIVKTNVYLLRKQTIPVDIILMVSNDQDQLLAKKLGVKHIRVPNTPLGKKWQLGVEEAKKYNPDGILINGSDDFLSPNYVKKAWSHLIKSNADLVGKKDWYIRDTVMQKSFYMKKNMYCVLGAGRIFRKRILDKLDWKLFPENKNSQLDAGSYNNLKKVGGKMSTIEDDSIVILSLKADHKMITPTKRIVQNQKPIAITSKQDKILNVIGKNYKNLIHTHKCMSELEKNIKS